MEAASIGSMVEIGCNCIIGSFAVIKDCAKITDNTVIAPGSVVPSMSIFSGSPGVWTEDMPEAAAEQFEAKARMAYHSFQSA